jgi:membrane dipeptidase
MTAPNRPLIFDGHNDVLTKQFKGGSAAFSAFANGNDCHIDLPKSVTGGFGGGFFAIWIPTQEFAGLDIDELMRQPTYDLPLPAEIPQEDAAPIALRQAAILARMEAKGMLKICTSTAQIRNCFSAGKMAAILHMEGAEPIDSNFDMLEILYRAGLRSLGPVWSRPTAFGHGVPFKYPSNGDIGPGLSDLGKDLVRECDRLGIMLDMSHLNEAGFWDIVNLSDAPIVATHSNAYAICPHARNLTDRQLAAIKDSNGLVGLNFATAFLRPDGQMLEDTGLDIVLRHLDHLIEHLGEDRVALGSDFDGAQVPAEIGNAAGLTKLRAAMRAHGYDEALMTKICHENWLRVLALSWRE